MIQLNTDIVQYGQQSTIDFIISGKSEHNLAAKELKLTMLLILA